MALVTLHKFPGYVAYLFWSLVFFFFFLIFLRFFFMNILMGEWREGGGRICRHQFAAGVEIAVRCAKIADVGLQLQDANTHPR